ncbi:MAG: hypothetical protein U9R14_02810, partial [Patescibacteria group bacterium]|nr:hypothetical protein [Patescibacteria group bacterium]
MKKGIVVLVSLLAIAWLTSGCGAMYGKKSQYDKGNWYGFTGSAEVARIEQDKLALKKLEAQPAQTAFINRVPQGYKGLVVNLDNRRRINIHIDGPEKKRYFLGPGQSEKDYLIHGKYVATAYRGNNLVGTWKFEVGAEQ